MGGERGEGRRGEVRLRGYADFHNNTKHVYYWYKGWAHLSFFSAYSTHTYRVGTHLAGSTTHSHIQEGAARLYRLLHTHQVHLF